MPSSVYPSDFEQKTGFNQIKEYLCKFTHNPAAHVKIESIHWTKDQNLLKILLEETDEFRRIYLDGQSLPVERYHDSTDTIKSKNVVGTWFDAEELFKLKESLIQLSKLKKFFSSLEKEKFPYITEKFSGLKLHEFVDHTINRIIDKSGHIRDNASKELQDIRTKLRRRQAETSKRLESILGEIKKAGWLEENLSATYLNGRLILPISTTYKRKLKGLIHGESSTGKTSYIEPEEIVEANNLLIELENEEKREIIKVLKAATDQIRPYFQDLLEAFDYLKEIDFINAKALFAIKINACLPEINNIDGIDLKDCFHPLLYLHLQAEKKNIVKQNIRLDKENRILVISGPNAGGKSVCLKTAALLQYMLQCGLLIPCHESSSCGIFDKVFIDIGNEQSIENDLSTYSSHLRNMKYFMQEANEKTILFIDEFGTGTEPHIGGAIAESVLEKINETGTFGIITTHYANIKHFALTADGITNGSMLFDHNRLEPSFVLEIGKPGSSYAFEIAAKTGLPKEILDRASEKAGKETIDLDKLLRQAQRDKKYWENKRKKIRDTEKKLDDVFEKNLKEFSDFEKEKKAILEKAKLEAGEIVKNANSKIEKTIREIREVQADKEKTKLIRKEFESAIKSKEPTKKDIELRTKIEILQKEVQKRKPEPLQKEEKRKKEKTEFTPGLFVSVKGYEQEGEILEVNPETLTIAFGNMFTTVPKKNARVIQQQPEKKNPDRSRSISGDLYTKKLKFSPEIDIRGLKAEETHAVLEKFIDDAFIVRCSRVKILHGTGYGILRKLTREYLKKRSEVVRFEDEILELGGAGITIAYLD